MAEGLRRHLDLLGEYLADLPEPRFLDRAPEPAYREAREMLGLAVIAREYGTVVLSWAGNPGGGPGTLAPG